MLLLFTVLFQAHVTLAVHTRQCFTLTLSVTPGAFSLGVTLPKFSHLAVC